MKIASIFIFILAFTSACQPNPSQRIRSGSDSNDQYNTGNPTTYNTGGSNLPNRDDTDGNDGSSDNGNEDNDDNDNWLDQLPVSVQGCQWSEDGQSGFAYHHESIGAFTICRDNNEEEEVYFQIQNTPSDPVCIIPTYTNDNFTTYIGEPKCFPAHSSQQIYKISLEKNRTGASHLELNGVSLMTDTSEYYPFPYSQRVSNPDAYLYCLQALEQYADARYCYAFDHVGQYVQHDF